MISTYVKLLSVTSRMLENRIILVFDGVMTYFELFVNGQRQVSTRRLLKSMFDITGLCKEGPNRIVLRVDSHEREDIPPFGYAIDYMPTAAFTGMSGFTAAARSLWNAP